MRRGRYGQFGKHCEVFDLWESFNEDPAMAEAMGLSEDAQLYEGSGAPEGRADFPYFLQTVIRFRMRERFAAVASIWRSFVGIESAQDFRENRIVELGGIWGMGPIQEFGEYGRMRSTERPGPGYAVGKHGGVYGVTFELIVNDMVDKILNRIPGEIGRTNGEYISQMVVAFMESNPTYIDGTAFFHASRANIITGVTADPSEDNLASAMETMRMRRDANGVPFSVQPRRVLVRGDLQRMRILQILNSATLQWATVGATAQGNLSFARGTNNPMQGLLPNDAVVQEPWLNDPNDWYIFGDAQDRPAFIVAFLRGNQEPFIGLKDPQVRNAMGAGTDPYDFDFDSIDFKIRSIVGTGQGEPLAAMKMVPS